MDYLEIAREHLRREAEQAAQPAPEPDPGAAVEDMLKGSAVLLVLDADGSRVWLVADQEDAEALGDVGADTVLTRGDVQILAAIREPEIRAEVLRFKRTLRGGAMRTFERLGVREQVTCGACRHFEPDPAGCGGIGSCAIAGEGVGGRLPLYPKALRFCRDWES